MNLAQKGGQGRRCSETAEKGSKCAAATSGVMSMQKWIAGGGREPGPLQQNSMSISMIKFRSLRLLSRLAILPKIDLRKGRAAPGRLAACLGTDASTGRGAGQLAASAGSNVQAEVLSNRVAAPHSTSFWCLELPWAGPCSLSLYALPMSAGLETTEQTS